MKLLETYNTLLDEGVFMEARIGDPCECCDYFDFDGVKDKFAGLKHPVYFMVEKGESHELKHISPKNYITAIAKGFGLTYDEVIANVPSKAHVKQYSADMKAGKKFEIPWYRKGAGGQEGRHRVLAAMELGCSEVPIVVINSIPDDKVRDFVMKYKDLSREELGKVLKEMGYDGVSDLDWRDFTRYIDYRL
jgi:hypothetical protein